MAYFIHNKYDKASIDALVAIDQTANTVIDYYGDYETYKYLDTSAGFGILYDTLSYVTPGAVIHGGQSDKDNSHFNFQSSIVIKSIQRGIIYVSSSGTTEYNATVAISQVDETKTIVLLNGGGKSDSSLPCLISLSPNEIIVRALRNYTTSYQVIEYC